MFISVHMFAPSLRFIRIKCDVQFSFKCLSFTKVNVYCDMHSLIVSSFLCACILCTILGHPRRRGRGNRHPKTARPCEALGITPGHPTMQ